MMYQLQQNVLFHTKIKEEPTKVMIISVVVKILRFVNSYEFIIFIYHPSFLIVRKLIWINKSTEQERNVLQTSSICPDA